MQTNHLSAALSVLKEPRIAVQLSSGAEWCGRWEWLRPPYEDAPKLFAVNGVIVDVAAIVSVRADR